MLLCCSAGAAASERDVGAAAAPAPGALDEELVAGDGVAFLSERSEPSGRGQAEAESGAAQELEEDTTAPGAEFCVTIQKADSESSAGLELDPKDRVTAVVTAVWPGPVLTWNTAHRDLEVRPNDRILSVNDASGDVQLLLNRLQQDTQLVMLLRRPTEFRVSVAAQRSLGISVSYAPRGTSLLVDEMGSRGLLRVWNSANPGREVEVRDRIVEVNGIRGSPELLLRELKSSGALELVLFR